MPQVYETSPWRPGNRYIGSSRIFPAELQHPVKIQKSAEQIQGASYRDMQPSLSGTPDPKQILIRSDASRIGNGNIGVSSQKTDQGPLYACRLTLNICRVNEEFVTER